MTTRRLTWRSLSVKKPDPRVTETMHRLGGCLNQSNEKPMAPTELENLRILSETAAHLRAAPESRWAKRRRDEALRWAARSHSIQEVAAAAEIPAEAVAEALRGPTADSESAAPASSERRWIQPHLPARFRAVR
jgi:hypothetical protein